MLNAKLDIHLDSNRSYSKIINKVTEYLTIHNFNCTTRINVKSHNPAIKNY